MWRNRLLATETSSCLWVDCPIVYRTSWGVVCQANPLMYFLWPSVCQKVTYTSGHLSGFRLRRYLPGEVSSHQLWWNRNRLHVCQKQVTVTSSLACAVQRKRWPCKHTQRKRFAVALFSVCFQQWNASLIVLFRNLCNDLSQLFVAMIASYNEGKITGCFKFAFQHLTYWFLVFITTYFQQRS